MTESIEILTNVYSEALINETSLIVSNSKVVESIISSNVRLKRLATVSTRKPIKLGLVVSGVKLLEFEMNDSCRFEVSEIPPGNILRDTGDIPTFSLI